MVVSDDSFSTGRPVARISRHTIYESAFRRQFARSANVNHYRPRTGPVTGRVRERVANWRETEAVSATRTDTYGVTKGIRHTTPETSEERTRTVLERTEKCCCLSRGGRFTVHPVDESATRVRPATEGHEPGRRTPTRRHCPHEHPDFERGPTRSVYLVPKHHVSLNAVLQNEITCRDGGNQSTSVRDKVHYPFPWDNT